MMSSNRSRANPGGLRLKMRSAVLRLWSCAVERNSLTMARQVGDQPVCPWRFFQPLVVIVEIVVYDLGFRIASFGDVCKQA